jgi:hypothetical protein
MNWWTKDDGTKICMVAHNYPWDRRQLKVFTLNGTMKHTFTRAAILEIR